MKELSLERLKEVLHYDPETGIFTWIKQLSAYGKVGQIAGSFKGHLYGRIQIDKKTYYMHHLAWFYYYEKFPDIEIDHINLDKHDNKIANLRASNKSQNAWNRKISKINTSGVKGVSFNTARQKWCATIGANGKSIFLGSSYDKNDAICLRWTALEKYHGEYGRI